jgi:RND family efflux transporter MFP subunit
MSAAAPTREVARLVRLAILAVVMAGGVVFLLLALAGTFRPKVHAGPPAAANAATQPAGDLVTVRVLKVPRSESAVGRTEAVREARVASKVMARVEEVRVQAGQLVEANDVLIRLDDADLRARLDRSDAQMLAAQASDRQAQVEAERVRKLAEGQNVAAIELERAETALREAAAQLEAAVQARREAETNLDYTVIRSPMTGIVVDREVEVGDMATPGQGLLSVYDNTHMRMVASVRETLRPHLAVGGPIGVEIAELGLHCTGNVSEIVPRVEPGSRSFIVKVTGPCPPGVCPGMFGRVFVTLGDESVVVVPQRAVRQVGQVALVDVVAGSQRQRRAVTLGRRFGDDVEVLSGLEAGEQVVAAPAS